jgi:signal transduction histidine kinase
MPAQPWWERAVRVLDHARRPFSRRWQILVVAAVLYAYVFAFPSLYLRLRGDASIPGVIFVILVAAFWGFNMGVAWALIIFALTTLQLYLVGHLTGWDAYLQQGVPGAAVLLLVGAAVGRLHDLGEALKRQLAARERAQDELRQKERRLRLLIEQLPAVLWSTDTDLRFTSSLGAGLRNLDLLPNQVVGLTLYEYFQTNDPEFLPIARHRRALAGFSSSYQIEWRDRIFQTHVEPLEGPDGGIVGTVSVAVDITELRHADDARRGREAAEAASRAKSEFLSRMSHELRTPLNAILGFAQLLEMDDLRSTQRESVTHILEAGRHLLDLINEVLDITRIEAGRLALALEPVGVPALVEETLPLVAPLAAARAVRLNGGPGQVAAIDVLADRQRLRQVLINLLSNSVKYNRPGGAVTITARPVAGRVRLEVSDTGVGIPADRLAQLFTPFERLAAGQSEVEGTGLGLALSRRLIEAMGGAIGVESTVGVGSTFWVELPAAAVPALR